MCRMCNDPNTTIADLRAEMFRAIEEYGWLVQHVIGEPGYPAFTYTIGLTDHDLPELYVQGCGPTQAGAVLNEVAGALVLGELRDGTQYTTSLGETYLLTPMPATDELLGALECYGPDVRGLELVQVD